MKHRNRFNWMKVEAVIKAHPDKTRRELADMVGCHYGSPTFRQLCLRNQVKNVSGQRPGKGGKECKRGNKSVLVPSKCPTCWAKHMSDTPHDYCRLHVGNRTQPDDATKYLAL